VNLRAWRSKRFVRLAVNRSCTRLIIDVVLRMTRLYAALRQRARSNQVRCLVGRTSTSEMLTRSGCVTT
jgi:hypothetical protein